MIVTKELKSNSSTCRSSYEDLIKTFTVTLPLLLNKLRVTMPSVCWINEALETVVKTHNLLENEEELKIYFKNGTKRWNVTSSIITLTEFQFIINNAYLFGEENIQEFSRKLKAIMNMPLLVKDESAAKGTNAGRNSLFELRLFLKFALAGFNVSLEEHPDILVKANGREYAIECKRIFKEETFIKNIKKARDQIKKYSLTSRNSYGIVALSITRAFHKGDLKLVTKTVSQASNTAAHYMDLLYKKHAKEISTILNYKFPVILLDYSDISEIDVPYWIQQMSLYKLVSSNRVLSDLEALSTTDIFRE